MSMLQPISGQGYLKAGFQGFSKSGKTYTAALLAIGARRFFDLQGPIAMFDTETGSSYIRDMVREATGRDLLGIKSRSFADMLALGREAEAAAISVYLVDSVTHPWREVCDAYLQSVNKIRADKGLKPRTRLEFQDWNPIKQKWAEWTDFYLNSKLHIVICGRAGFEYDYEVNEETGKKELQKTGIKMKTEGEFGFEPSLLVEMERIIERPDDATAKIVHRATVLGDRFNVIDAKTAINPTFEFFQPHLLKLIPGEHSPVNTEVKTQVISDEGDAQWQNERRARTILCEEIQGELVRKWPGLTAEEKKHKTEAVEKAFGTRSWTKVENLDSSILRAGLEKIKQMITTEAK